MFLDKFQAGACRFAKHIAMMREVQTLEFSKMYVCCARPGVKGQEFNLIRPKSTRAPSHGFREELL